MARKRHLAEPKQCGCMICSTIVDFPLLIDMQPVKESFRIPVSNRYEEVFMNWTKLIQNKWLQSGLCIVLAVAILLGLCIPGAFLKTVQPDSPLDQDWFYDMEELLLGEGKQEQEEGEDPNKGSNSSQPEETQPEETQPEETQPEETQPEETQPEETQPEETQPEETQPEETVPNDTESEEQSDGDGDEGQEDGNRGEDGGEEAELDLSMVMTWYKYATQAKTIVCGASDTVSKTINTAQLSNNQLKFHFSLTGEEAEYVSISKVSVKAGDGLFSEISHSGTIQIEVPEGGKRDYTFCVDTLLKKRDNQGQIIEQEVQFTYVLHCSYSLDLELELVWKEKTDTTGKTTCAANKTAVKTVESNELIENVFTYTPKLVGALAENAVIVDAQYMTGSGESGNLQITGGSLVFGTQGGADKETYYLTFEAQLTDSEGEVQTVFYHITIVFAESADVDLSFTWLERGITRKTSICQPDGKVTLNIKNNQLSAGAIKYEIELTGEDAAAARILNISYTSEATGGGKLDASGALALTLPSGYTSNTYTILVVALINGKQLNYEIVLHYTMDVRLEMRYSVTQDGVSSMRNVVCENGKVKTAEAIYDDQLSDGWLAYDMVIAGAEEAEITAVSCYQSGNGRQISLTSAGDIQLLLKDGKTGENNFVITAEDGNGIVYEFKINIPYKHRGEKSVKITTNMTEGQVVTNETPTNLNVRAWTEDAGGNVVSQIPANGVDTKLIVTLDGEEIQYISSSGPASEYILYPSNPEVGDTNNHILYIYAEDAFGNYGELTLNLKGQRNQAGQKKGTATIYVDLTTVGLGVAGAVTYEVLADEPISYSIAKAVMGQDTADPFGAAENSLGWGGAYAGTLDVGFYLQRLTPGLTANALTGGPWSQYGSSEEEILQTIDNYFGKGTGLATLWRCIYRNGLNKSSGSGGSFGEHDYSQGSGWLYSLNGTYYPGLSMSEYSLENGDVLTLRYTLAYGWDVGGSTTGYGNAVGYCVTALNGSYYINHQMENVENEDGSIRYVCHCCGLVEDCAHEHTVGKNLGDDTHVMFCEDCKTAIGDPQAHDWLWAETEHTCSVCDAAEQHTWKEVEGSNTATCTQPGTRKVYCTVCQMDKEEESPIKGHELNSRWNHDKTEHYQKCSVCKEIIPESKGRHQYEYHAGDDDWYCKICDAGHDWDYCGNQDLVIYAEACQKITYYCDECDMELVKNGSFPEHHSYVDGYCAYCGEADPNSGATEPPETEPEPEPEPKPEPEPEPEPEPTPQPEEGGGDLGGESA